MCRRAAFQHGSLRGAFFVQTSFGFVKAVYGLTAVQLFISAQWDARRLSAGERFGVFAVLVERRVRLCHFRGLSCKIGSGLRRQNTSRICLQYFGGYRVITWIYTSVNTVYSHNLHLEQL